MHYISFVRRPRRGQTLVTYGLILALIAIVTVGAVNALGGSVQDQFSSADAAFDGAAGDPSATPAPMTATVPDFGFAGYSVTDNGDGSAFVEYTATGDAPISQFTITTDLESRNDAAGDLNASCGSTITLEAGSTTYGYSAMGLEFYTVDCADAELTGSSSVVLDATLSDDGTNMTAIADVTAFGPNPAGFFTFSVSHADTTWLDGTDGASSTATFTVACSAIASQPVYITAAAYEGSDWSGPFGYVTAILPDCQG